MMERVTGRILSVWEEEAGSSLTADAALAATTLAVDDVSPFNDDADTDTAGNLGYLLVNGQTVGYTAVDDDASTVTLAAGLDAAATDGDQVSVWNDLYDEADTIQKALVVLDGHDNNVDPIEALVSDTVENLANEDRGRPRETCVLERDGDEWVLIHAWGRPSRARGLKFEANDSYILTPDDITAGTATVPLSQRPIDESLKLWWNTVWQEPTEYTVDAVAQTVTFPLDGFEAAGQRVAVHYAYRRGLISDPLAFGEAWATYVASLSPIQWLRLDETGLGVTTAQDSSTHNRDATYEGFTANAGTVAGATADGNTAQSLAGTDDAISWNLDNAWVPKPNQSWSVLALFKTAMAGTGTICSMVPNGTSAAGTTLNFYVTSGILTAETWDTSGDVVTAGTVNDNTWRMGVVTYNGTSRLLSLYEAGALADSGVQNSTFNTDDRTLQWGRRRVSGSSYDRYWDGGLDECLLFNFELTAEQVSNLWAAKDIA